jgi:hypothetical protein
MVLDGGKKICVDSVEINNGTGEKNGKATNPRL